MHGATYVKERSLSTRLQTTHRDVGTEFAALLVARWTLERLWAYERAKQSENVVDIHKTRRPERTVDRVTPESSASSFGFSSTQACVQHERS